MKKTWRSRSTVLASGVAVLLGMGLHLWAASSAEGPVVTKGVAGQCTVVTPTLSFPATGQTKCYEEGQLVIFPVATAGGGRDALARLETGETMDLVLTDLKMPEMSGWEVVQAVRPVLPVASRAHDRYPLPLEQQREPVDVLLTKPMTLEQLHRAVACCEGLNDFSANQDQL